MTATDELPRMLDERGVKWWKASPCKTKWHSPVLGGPVAVRELNGKMVLDAGYVNVTPEQAIDATLGNNDTSRWYKLFGTPERAAGTLETVAEALYASAWADDSATLSDVLCSLVAKCDACPAMGAPGCGVSTRCGAVDYKMMLEWLRGDAE